MYESKISLVLRRMRDAAAKNIESKNIESLQDSSYCSHSGQIEHDEPLTEDVNKFIFKFRRLYLSGKMMKFKDWIREMEDLIDALG